MLNVLQKKNMYQKKKNIRRKKLPQRSNVSSCSITLSCILSVTTVKLVSLHVTSRFETCSERSAVRSRVSARAELRSSIRATRPDTTHVRRFDPRMILYRSFQSVRTHARTNIHIHERALRKSLDSHRPGVFV